MHTVDSYNSDRISYSSNCIDCSSNPESSLCYEVVDGANNFRCFYSREIYGCRDCSYCLECTSCHDCFGCTNLTNGSYQIYNKQYFQDDYKKILQELLTKKNIETYWKNAIRKSVNVLGSTNVI